MFPSTIFSISFFIILFLFQCPVEGSYSTTLTIVNRCSIEVYPAIFNVNGTSVPSTTGFSLQRNESKVLTMSDSWSGRLWGRTYCSNDSKGMFSCLTGDCASSIMECNSGDASPPATLAEFNLNAKSDRVDYFRISVVNGYNLPMMVEPQVGNGNGDCLKTSCMVHLNEICPLELKKMRNKTCIGCKSAWQPLSKYPESFKKACPHANVDPNPTKTFKGVCASTDYVVTFCPSPIQQRKEKNPTTVDNSGDQKKGLTNIVKIILAVLGSLGCCAIGGGLYFAFGCHISYSTQHGWNFGSSARIGASRNSVPDNS